MSRGTLPALEQTRVVQVDEAPNWAAIRFGVDSALWDLRLLRAPLGCTEIGISVFRLGARAKFTVGHRHPAGEEIYVLVSGQAEIKIGDSVFALDPMSAVRVPSHKFRALRNPADELALLIVAGYPQDSAEEVEFAPDFWPADDDETAVPLNV
jgi:mannose-6-phosphate isomerase-like protein (cupin superfamily)